MEINRTYKNHIIKACITSLDYGFLVQLVGGELSHIGAVAVSGEKDMLGTITVPGHKENLMARDWASALGAATRQPVCVVAGIHYEHLHYEEIQDILRLTESMKQEAIHLLEK